MLERLALELLLRLGYHMGDSAFSKCFVDLFHLTVTVNDENKPLRWLIGQLWNCRDMLQGAACDDLDLPRGTTYAQAVRKMASTLKTEETGKGKAARKVSRTRISREMDC